MDDPPAFATYFMDPGSGCLSLEPGTPVMIDDARFGLLRFHISGDPLPYWTLRDAIQ